MGWLEGKGRGKELWGFDVGVAVHDAEAGELGGFQAGDHAEDALLLAPSEAGLEADHPPKHALDVLLSQLDDGIRAIAGSRVGEADGLHRPEGEGLPATRGKLLDRHASLEELETLELGEGDSLGGDQGLPEGVVLDLAHGAIEVVGVTLAVPRRAKDLCIVNRIGSDRGGDGVIEVEVVAAREIGDRPCEGVGSQWAGGDDGDSIGYIGDFLADQRHIREIRHSAGHAFGEMLPVNRQRLARGKAILVGTGDYNRVQEAHLRLQESRGVGEQIGLQRVAADEFGQAAGLVDGSLLRWAHLVEANGYSGPGGMPCGLRPRQTSTDDGQIMRCLWP